MIPKGRILCLFSVVVLFVFVGTSSAQQEVSLHMTIEEAKKLLGVEKFIKLVVGETTVRGCCEDTWLVSVGNPAIADVELKHVEVKEGVKRKYVLIKAKAPGVTNLVVCKKDDTEVLGLLVTVDAARYNLIKQKLKEILPDEGIKVNIVGDSIILSGEVSSTINVSKAVEVTKSFVPEGKEEKVVNLMQVGGVQQVMLEVRVAEMGRELMRRLGFNFSYISGPDFGISLLNELTSFLEEEEEGVRRFFVTPTSRINALFRFHHGRASWTGYIDALKSEGIVKILAEPTLIALSGQEAEFLAGGEFPVPVPQPGMGYAMITIEYKPYGVGLTFTPRVLSNDKISMTVAPEVSELDYENAIAIMGYTVPALTTRRSSTTIELDDGQSFAIAGLLRENVYQNIEKFPILGTIPILGALFRSSEFKRHESELVIIVTPHLVKPLDMTRQTLPTDAYVEPDDFEFYLLGLIEGAPKEKKRPPAVPKEEGLEGKFGHIAP